MPVWTRSLTTITVQPQEPTPHLGTLNRGPGTLGNWICERKQVGEVGGGGQCDSSLWLLALFFSEENQLSDISKGSNQGLIVIYPCVAPSSPRVLP